MTGQVNTTDGATTMNEPDTTAWADAPIQFIPIVVCQFCGSPDLMRVRTESGGDGSFSRKLICKKCSRKNLVVYELPETGKAVSGDW